jgi:hypothetical protein
MKKIVLKSHFVKSNHRVLRNTKIDNFGAPVLHLIIMPLFWWLKCILTPMNIRYLWFKQRSLTDWEGSVQLTSLY